jgi:hypothetical protein
MFRHSSRPQFAILRDTRKGGFMISLIVPILAVSVFAQADDGIHDIRSLIAAIEAVQQPIEDFRCEFEGSVTYKGPVAEREKKLIDGNGVFDMLGGTFIWKQGGETFIDTFHRRGGDGVVYTEKIMIRPQERVFEHHNHPGGRGIANVDIRDLDEIVLSNYENPERFFLIDSFKALRDRDTFVTSVSDEEREGRRLKVLTVYFVFKGTELPNRLVARYWIDLQRGGRAVRCETYMDDAISGVTEFTLKSFKVGKEDVWMPIAAATTSYLYVNADNAVTIDDEPTILQTLAVINGTMEFNTHPRPEVFTKNYKPGTPISDHIRKLQYQFGQDKLKPLPTKAEVEAMLNSQLARAEEQKNGLVAAPLTEGVDWWWLSAATGFGAAVAGSLVLLWAQRRAG